jgi:excisionase family DNA binding protein
MAAVETPRNGLEPLLSIKEVAVYLGISESGVYRLLRAGELAGVKVGNRTLFEPQEVRRFIEASRRQANDGEVLSPTEETREA